MQLQASIKVGNILPGRNPRGYFDPSEMTALEDSVKSKGVLQAILVRPRDAGRYESVAGVRQRRCSGMSMKSRHWCATWTMAKPTRRR